MNDLVLSVVVIGRNEGSRLTLCLESLIRVRGIEGKTESIYVDSASVDGSPETARSLGANVIVINDGNLSAARSRNAGWRTARAPYLLFLDGDTIVEPDFPRIALRALSTDRRIAAVWGHRREVFPERSIYNRVLDLDWVYPPGETEFCGGDVLLRKSALEEVGGYDSTLMAGEEPELCRRLRGRGYRILHIDVPMTRHDLNILRFSQYWKRAIRTGRAYAQVSARFRTSKDPMWIRESYGNFMRGGFLALSFAASVVALRVSFAPLTAWFAMLALLSARSAWRARWKAHGQYVLLLWYGLHSQLQHIPILIGQCQALWDKTTGGRNRFIDYKSKNSNGHKNSVLVEVSQSISQVASHPLDSMRE